MNNFIEIEDMVTNNLSEAEFTLKNISTKLSTMITKALNGDLSNKALNEVIDNFHSVNSNLTFVIEKLK